MPKSRKLIRERNRLKRWLALIMAVLTAISAMPSLTVPVYAEDSGRLVLTVVTEDKIVIAPEYVSYDEGMSVKEALLSSGHQFNGLDVDAFISAVDGQADNYIMYLDGGSADLSVKAAQVSALFMTADSKVEYADSILELCVEMAAFKESEDGRQNDAACECAYEAALTSLYGITGADATAALQALKAAEADYDAYLNGGTYDIKLALSQGAEMVIPAFAEMTDSRGQVTTVRYTDSVPLKAGTYGFLIGDGKGCYVRGTYHVAGEGTLQAAFPEKDWIENVSVGLKSGWLPEKESVGSEPLSDDKNDRGAVYAVPDYAGPNLYPYITATEGTVMSGENSIGVYLQDSESARAWKSTTVNLPQVIEADSLKDEDIILEARYRNNPHDNYEQFEIWRMEVRRVPTLKTLSIADDYNELVLENDSGSVGFVRETAAYETQTIGSVLTLSTEDDMNGKTVTAAGVPFVGGQAVVDLTNCDSDAGVYYVPVTVKSSNGMSFTYDIEVTHVDSVEMTLSTEESVTAALTDEAGNIVKAFGENRYVLPKNQRYTVTATKDNRYHAEMTIISDKSGNVECPTPKTGDALTSLEVRQSSAVAASAYPLVPGFSTEIHDYKVKAPSTSAVLYLKAEAKAADTEVSASWFNLGTNKVQSIALGDGFSNLSNVIRQSGLSTDITIKAEEPVNSSGVTYYQEYRLTVCRVLQLSAMGVSTGDRTQLLEQVGSDTVGFNKTVLDYKMAVSQKTASLTVSLTPLTAVNANDRAMVIYVGDTTVTYDEDHLPNKVQSITVSLDTEKSEEMIAIKVTHPDENSVSQTYRIKVTKLPPIRTQIKVLPETVESNIFMTAIDDDYHVFPDEDGCFELDMSREYVCHITALGYVGRKIGFTAGSDNAEMTVTLVKAPETDITDISGEDDWSSFRADKNNNGVINAETPVAAEDTMLLWANKVGSGYDTGAVGCPILVGGYLYTYAGKQILKIDRNTGEVVLTGDMTASSSFAINSPTYAEGMIFVGLSNGRVQAFNAETLESLWIYEDSLGGQPNSTIAYRDGYVYTGFWNSETKKAHFVCLSITDEDPHTSDEEKLASWTYTDKGFYWAGAYTSENYLLVTTDDGEAGYTTGYGSLLSLDRASGAVIDSLQVNGKGDLRSSVCYDPQTDAFYFTSKGGYFFSVKVNEDGTIRKDTLKSLVLDNGSDNEKTPGMSTSTPTIYNGRAYIGVCGTSQFTPYSGHNLTVIDLASWSVAYTVPTEGYPQTSGVLTTAYEAESSYVYVYFFDNYTPGKLRVIRDKAGMTEPDHDYLTTETYTTGGKNYTVETAYVLFTPAAGQAQYAICSPIVDGDGNLYFKNDSGNLMCLTSAFGSLEIENQPDRLKYCIGTTFDTKGLKAELVYANGRRVDVTDYISVSTEPLTADDEEITVIYDPNKRLKGDTTYWTFYQDKDSEAGVILDLPTATVNITLQEHADADNNGRCDNCGAKLREIEKLEILSGAKRYDTAAAIAEAAYPAGCEPTKAVLVTGKLYPDALAANAYAGALNAPVLLTSPSSLSEQTYKLLNETWGGSVKEITIIGGGLSAAVTDKLKAMGILVKIISGANRYQTAAAVCEDGLKNSLFTNDICLVATGTSPADSLSVSSWSYAYHLPILLASGGKLKDVSREQIKKFKQVIVLGGESCLATSEIASVTKNYIRLSGAKRYDTSVAISRYFLEEYAQGTASVTNTVFAMAADDKFADALAGGMLAGQNGGAPILLVSGSNAASVVYRFTEEKLKGEDGPYYVLGAAASDNDVYAKIKAAVGE